MEDETKIEEYTRQLIKDNPALKKAWERVLAADAKYHIRLRKIDRKLEKLGKKLGKPICIAWLEYPIGIDFGDVMNRSESIKAGRVLIHGHYFEEKEE